MRWLTRWLFPTRPAPPTMPNRFRAVRVQTPHLPPWQIIDIAVRSWQSTSEQRVIAHCPDFQTAVAIERVLNAAQTVYDQQYANLHRLGEHLL